MHSVNQITYQRGSHLDSHPDQEEQLDHEYTEKTFTYDLQNRSLPLGWGCISCKIFQS